MNTDDNVAATNEILPHSVTYGYESAQKHECFKTYLNITDKLKLTKNL